MDVPPTEDTQAEGLVTYEQPESDAASQEIQSPSVSGRLRLPRQWPWVLLIVGGGLTLFAMWSWAARANTPDAGQRIQLVRHAMDHGDLVAMQEHLEIFAFLIF